jgi:mannosyltransferase
MDSPGKRPLAFLWIVVLLACQLAYCAILSPKKEYWGDEILTAFVIERPTLAQMWETCQQPINISPPLYFVTAWAWRQAVGTDAMTLRLFSAVCMMGAAVTWWVLLKRSVGHVAADTGVLFCFCLSGLLQWHLCEARPYAMLLLWISLACLAAQSILAGRSTRSTWIGLALCHAAMMYTHYHGILYSLGLAALTGLACLLARRDLFKLMIATAGGWALFAPWVPTLLDHYRQTDAWHRPPTPRELFDVFSGNMTGLGFFLVLLFFAAAWLRGRPSLPRDDPDLHRRDTLVSLGLYLTGMILFIYAYSVVRRPIFYPRYMIGSYPLWAIIVAYSLAPIALLSRAIWWRRLPLLLVNLLLLAYLVYSAAKWPVEPKPDALLTAFTNKQLPVVDENAYEQLVRWRHGETPSRFLVVKDFYSPSTRPNQVAFYELIRPISPGLVVLTHQELLDRYPEFYFITRKDVG